MRELRPNASTDYIRKGNAVIDMVFVEGGVFQMGCQNGDSNEAPIHNVTLKSFYMSRHIVTNKIWNGAFGIKSDPGSDDYPHVNVSWIESIAFCNKLSLNEGFKPCYNIIDDEVFCEFNCDGYRLPTEAEWEFAAKGGIKSKGCLYSGSDNADDVAWHEGNSDKYVHEVGLKLPNELGIYDLSGNVYEFCWDVFENYGSNDQTNPLGPNRNKINLRRAIRGGNCFGFAYRVRCTSRRNGLYHKFTQDFVGIRLNRSFL
jgi:formylglycine-generating enzyme required for sulfatase activity